MTNQEKNSAAVEKVEMELDGNAMIEGDIDGMRCTCGCPLFDPAEWMPGERDTLGCDGCGKKWRVTLAAWSVDYEAQQEAAEEEAALLRRDEMAVGEHYSEDGT